MKCDRQLSFRPAAPVVALLGLLITTGPLPAAAQEFRVQSKVFSGKDDKPTNETLTLFSDGRVYDFLSSPREIVVFDFQRSRIVLLDPGRKLRTELNVERLNDFTDKLRARALKQSDPVLKFAADPQFTETRDGEGWLQFTSAPMTYRVRSVKPDNLAIVKAYRDFSDASARLNAMLYPGALPPFPRLAVNTSLERSGRVPEELELTVAPTNRLLGKPTVLRSQHELAAQLLPADRKKIDEAGEYLVNFQQVSLEEYLRPIQQAKR